MWGINMKTKHATRDELFYAIQTTCGKLFALEEKYAKLVRAEYDARRKTLNQIGRNSFFV